MEKLKLTHAQKVIFNQALHDSYKAGEENSTFLFNGMHALVSNEDALLKKVKANYLEEEEKVN